MTTSNEKSRFRVITNDELIFEDKDKPKTYQTNPIEDDLQEKFMKFVNRHSNNRFSVEDLLKW